ncbi:MAG: T9SS type A sorting domain-containing protein, partial [Bacteroidota bacterium]|nr:T9SS type A sorting domain-containing protein [Bacteroidota bacterium]
TVELGIKTTTHVKIVVYNSLGKEISNICDKDLFTGAYKFDWDATQSGIYFIKTIVGEKPVVKRVVVLE